MKETLYRLLIELTNGRLTSLLLKRFARSPISKIIVPSFARLYHLNLDEMEKKLEEFPTLHDLFVRKLKAGAREIHPDAATVTSPVDAVLEDSGKINDTCELFVKGKRYAVAEMLGDQSAIKKYINGTYLILYLSPSHYHRIHSPVTGVVEKRWTLGKKSFPVNKWGLQYGKSPLAKNYRMITEIKTQFGFVAVVKVGAMFVNSIEVSHLGESVKKGEEMAYFSFGSTVVLLFEKDIFQPESALEPPVELKVGEKIGYFSC
ncbi:phosphatidylserine decarboxylase [Neobacillus sp. SM06]|uniref:phosphatidylserine decarboxylase n=1 Tax=Neobacillus sp. SM06 TaxID=3422492 RepID=UPI003D275B6D